MVSVSVIPSFLACDWKATNAVRGLMQPSATYPCPICIAKRPFDFSLHHLLFCTHRPTRNLGRDWSQTHDPLLNIASDHIVPLPLHCFLGIGNKIIRQVLPKLYTQAAVNASVDSIKTAHAAPVGKAAFHDLTGVELEKYIKAEKLLAFDGGDESKKQKLQEWLRELHRHLLHRDTWTEDMLTQYRLFLQNILSEWKTVTGTAHLPKHHMLFHGLQFAEQHRFLGKVSEASMESCHGKWRALEQSTYFNKANKPGEWLRVVLQHLTVASLAEAKQAKFVSQ